jgi:hypothetical protein
MRVIVTAVPGAMPEPEDILAMSGANQDGGGVGWWDGERLRVFRNVDPLKVVGFIFSHWRDAPCLLRFRLATHGAVEPRHSIRIGAMWRITASMRLARTLPTPATWLTRGFTTIPCPTGKDMSRLYPPPRLPQMA